MFSRCHWLTAATIFSLAAPVMAQPPAGRPAGVDIVPSTTIAFVTVKVADLWDAETFKPVREAYVKEDSFIGGLEKQVGIAPGEVERVTMFWPTIPLGAGSDAPFLVVTTRKPYNEAKVLMALRAMPAGALFNPGEFRPPTDSPAPKPVPAPRAIKEPVPPVEKDNPPGLVGGAGDPVVKEDDSLPNGPELYFVENRELGALYLLDKRTLLFMPTRSRTGDANPSLFALLGQLLRRKADGPLAESLDLAGKHTIVAAGRVDQLDILVRNLAAARGDLPAEIVPFRSLLRARTATLTADLDTNAKLTAKLVFPDAAFAKRAESVLQTLIQMLGDQLVVARKAAAADEETAGIATPLLDLAKTALDKAEVKADGPAVTATAEAEIGPAVAKVLAAAPKAIQGAADRAKTSNNLKQIALAIHNYHDAMGHMPTDVVDPKTGKPILSWRVLILPYVEQDNIYRQMNLNAPWDDPQNKKFLEQMPSVFKVEGRETEAKGQTYLQMPSAEKPIPGGSPIKVSGQKSSIATISDGTSNTLMVVEAADSVLWMKPDDVQFGEKTLPKLGAPNRKWFLGAMADGSVQKFEKSKWSDKMLRALLTANGGEVIEIPR